MRVLVMLVLGLVVLHGVLLCLWLVWVVIVVCCFVFRGRSLFCGLLALICLLFSLQVGCHVSGVDVVVYDV